MDHNFSEGFSIKNLPAFYAKFDYLPDAIKTKIPLKKEKREQRVREPYFENPLFIDQQHLIVYRKKEDGKISPQNLIQNQLTKE